MPVTLLESTAPCATAIEVEALALAALAVAAAAAAGEELRDEAATRAAVEAAWEGSEAVTTRGQV